MTLRSISTREIVERLRTLESFAVIPRVASTNLIARRIVSECIENELSLPQAVIVAGEQFAGRGRNQRTWSSPAGKGIYATVLLTRTTAELSTMPLRIANIVASFLRETYGIDARVKWPNDILVQGRKMSGILIEARVQEERAFLIIGIGINLEPRQDPVLVRRPLTRRGQTPGSDHRLASIDPEHDVRVSNVHHQEV